jgi:hypothetical protein
MLPRLASNSYPPASASRSAGITGKYHHNQIVFDDLIVGKMKVKS